ncbi:MAG: hypothetical protein Q7J73_08190 [Dehalococcoidales bacterium]|nr:hypothetical protein [Dehalococcoidales bacterium]
MNAQIAARHVTAAETLTTAAIISSNTLSSVAIATAYPSKMIQEV